MAFVPEGQADSSQARSPWDKYISTRRRRAAVQRPESKRPGRQTMDEQ
jgi:hypothetical protein